MGERSFWYRLTRVVPDKIHKAVKRLCVYVCTGPTSAVVASFISKMTPARSVGVDKTAAAARHLHYGRNVNITRYKPAYLNLTSTMQATDRIASPPAPA